MTKHSNLLDEIFDRYYRQLIAWCRSRVRHIPGDPEDFVHSAYLRCRRTWSDERRSQIDDRAYLFRALRWVILDAVRRNVRERARTWQGGSRTVPVAGHALNRLLAEEAILLLKGRQLQVCLALLTGMSRAEIGKRFNLSPGALAVYICRARTTLSRLLESPTGC